MTMHDVSMVTESLSKNVPALFFLPLPALVVYVNVLMSLPVK